MAADRKTADSPSNGIPERLIAATASLLATQGPSAVKARAVAAEAGMSSMVVYNYFGGVPELLHAVSDHGFRQIEAAFVENGITDDPIADLFAMALRTLAYARANPHLYDAMFGLSTRATYRPSTGRADRLSGHSPAFTAAYAHVIAGAQRLGDDRRLTVNDHRAAAAALWSSVHGYITLELADHFSDFDDPVRQVLLPMGVTLCVGLGADPEMVQASHEAALARVKLPEAARPS